jgi:hypothetical protein
MLVEWDKSNPEKPKISERFHSDVLDAALYAYMRCLEWLYEPPKPKYPDAYSPAWYAAEAKRQADELEAQLEVQMQANREANNEEREMKEWA